MKNHNDQAMETYFNSMLSDKESDDFSDKLSGLNPITPIQSEQKVSVEKDEYVDQVALLNERKAIAEDAIQADVWKNLDSGNEFQVLFFELAGLTFAIPLVDLGGIHHLELPLNSLFGKPDWFYGVASKGKSLYNIVDTGKWIGSEESSDSLNYSHYILLGSTEWGLSCEKLLGTETLTSEQVKWRKVKGKRPWLAGMVKGRMCALIHVQELIKLLNNGTNIHGN